MSRSHRPGVTLIEVLVAIFVMAIGLLALLVLFPLGALRMAQAIRDDRTGQTGSNAAAVINAKNLRFDPQILLDPFGNLSDPYANPLPSPPIFPGPVRALDPNGPSFPVLVDPNGWMSLLPTARHWAPANIHGVLSRRNLSFVGGVPADRYRWFNLLDDITFQRDVAFRDQMGSPMIPSPNAIERTYLYTWAYMLQKPRLLEQAVIDCTVVVYERRPTKLTNETALAEWLYDANPNGLIVSKTTFDTTRNSVVIDYSKGPQPPPLRVGSWLLDCSYGPAWPAGVPAPHGTFYRVVGVNDNLATQQMEVEVQPPLRGFPASTTNIPGTVLIMEGVVEVFERGPGR